LDPSRCSSSSIGRRGRRGRRPNKACWAAHWKILKLFAANGADLSAPGAAPFAADLRKTEVPLYAGLYIDLK